MWTLKKIKIVRDICRIINLNKELVKFPIRACIHNTSDKYVKREIIDLASEEFNYYYELEPNGRVIVATGLVLDIPKGYELQIRTKTQTAMSKGLVVLNSPCHIGHGYNKEIKVLLYNASNKSVKVWDEDIIADVFLNKLYKFKIV